MESESQLMTWEDEAKQGSTAHLTQPAHREWWAMPTLQNLTCDG